ncbi:hypothetical protein KFL_001560260 [Klebsormidium nitens]|uniref:Uncharacterized protein n=1 Tax=Klebsormidium nitens TaxID=105231 RepID=A0A1Y1I6D0_KLENI|nr:hypothetical protein KFL_001560260 [Klebsormidium nitens]|eukprot:GAQ83658.1 hypothetical protein KFL_001560260 [Klebsormidium nitens]
MDSEREAPSERVLSQVSENVPMGNADCASSADWNAALFTPVKLPTSAVTCAETTPVREMEAFVESQVRALGPMRASLDGNAEEEARKMTEDLTSEDGHAAAHERLAKLLHAEKENAVLRQHIESLKDKELDLALESGKEELRRQEQMQAQHRTAMAAAAREIEHLRTECMKLGGVLESRQAEDVAREETEQELLELLAIVQENVQLSKQVQAEVQRAGFDVEGGGLSVGPGKDQGPEDADAEFVFTESRDGLGPTNSAGSDAPEKATDPFARTNRLTKQRPRPKSAGAVSESHWSKGTVVFTPALERAGSGGLGVGGMLTSSAEGMVRDPPGKKGHGRLTARIRELEAQLEEALAAQQVSANLSTPEPTEEMRELLLVVSQVERMERHIEAQSGFSKKPKFDFLFPTGVGVSSAPEPTEEMRELLLVVSQVERMERHIDDLTKENHRLRAAAAQPSPRSHLDIGVTSPLSDAEPGVNSPSSDEERGVNAPNFRDGGFGTSLSDPEPGVKTLFRQGGNRVKASHEQGVNADSKEEEALRELREKVETLETKLSNSVQALAEKEGALSQSAAALAASEEEKARLRRKLEVLEMELGATHSLLEESEAGRQSVLEGRDEGTGDVMLMAQLEAAIQEADGLRGQLADALGELAGAQEREEVAAQETERLRGAMRDLEARDRERAKNSVRETERMTAGLEGEVEKWALRMEEEKERLKSQMREDVEKRTVELEREMERLRKAIERVEEEEGSKQEAEKWATATEGLRGELERAEKAREAVLEEAENLRGELGKERQGVDMQRERATGLEVDLERVTTDLRVLVEERENERSEWEEGLSACVRAAEAQAEVLTSEMKEVKRDLEKTVESLVSATAQLASERKAVADQSESREKAEAEVEKLQKELGLAANREVGLMNQLAECEKALAECERALAIAEEETVRFREDLAGAADRAIRLSEQVGATESARERAETELKRLRVDLAEARKVGGQMAGTKEALFLAEAALSAAEERARGAEEEANRASAELEAVREELERARKKVGGEQQRLEARLEKARAEWQEELDRLLTATEQRYSEGLESALAGAKLEWEQNTELLVTETRRECGWETEGQLAALRKGFEESLENLDKDLEQKGAEIETLRQELRSEKGKLEQVSAQKDELRRGLEASVTEVNKLEETLEAERAEVAELDVALEAERAKVGKLEEALELERVKAGKLEEVLDLERAKLGELGEALELEREKVAELAKLEEALELERAKSREEVESVTALLEVARAQSRDKEGEIVEFVQQLDAAQSECAALAGRLQIAERQLEAGRETVVSDTDELQRQLDDALKLGEEALSGIEEKEEQLAGLRKQLGEVKAQLKEAVAACDAAKEEADLSDARAVQMEREMSELRTQRQEAREALEAACRKGEEAEKRGDAARAELLSVRSELNGVQTELESVQSELESVRREFEGVRMRLEGVRKELSDAEKQSAAVQGERDHVKKELEGVRAGLDTVRRDLDTVRSERDSVRSELESVRKDFDAARNERDVIEKECEKVRDGTRALATALEEARQSLAGKEEELRNAAEVREREVGAFGEAVEVAKLRWERESKEVQAALAAAVGALSEKEMEVAALGEKMRSLRERFDKAEAEIVRRKEEGERLGVSLGDFEASLADAKEKLRAADATRAALENQIAKLCHVDGAKGRHVSAAELSAVEEELAATRRALEARKGIVEEMTRQLDTCQEESRVWEEKVARLEEDLAETQDEFEKRVGLWAVILVAGWCAVVKSRNTTERKADTGRADTGIRRGERQADSGVRKKLAFHADDPQAEGSVLAVEGDLETGFEGDVGAPKTGRKALHGTKGRPSPGVKPGAETSPENSLNPPPTDEVLVGVPIPGNEVPNAGGVETARRASPGNEVKSAPGDDVAAAQRMLSDLRQQSEWLHVELAGLAVAEKRDDRRRQADVSGPFEAGGGNDEGSTEDELREKLLGLLSRLHDIQASLLKCLGPVSAGGIGRKTSSPNLLHPSSDSPDVETIFGRVLMVLKDNTHLWAKIRDLPSIPSTLEQSHAASLRELESLVAAHETLQRELQRHARSPQPQETATRKTTTTEGSSQRGEGSFRGGNNKGSRDGGVQSDMDLVGGTVTDGERAGGVQNGVQKGEYADTDEERALEQDERGGVRLAGIGAGCEGPSRLERGEGNDDDVDDDDTGSVDPSDQLEGGNSEMFRKLSLSEREPTLAVGLDGGMTAKFSAGVGLSLGLPKPPGEAGGLERGLSGTSGGLEQEPFVKVWGGEVSVPGGSRAWFNPVFAEEEGGVEGRRDSGEGAGLGLGTAIAEVLGDRDRLLKQNGRLVIELETLKSRFSVSESELERARSALASAAALASKLDLAYGQLVRELETVRKERDDLALTSAPTRVTSAGMFRTVRTPERAVPTVLPPVRTPGTSRAREEARKRGIEGGGGREDKRRRQDGNEGGDKVDVGLRGGVDSGLESRGGGEGLELSLEEKRAAQLGMAAGVSEAEERRHLRSILERVLEEKRRLEASLSEQTTALELVTRQRRHDGKRAKRAEAECRTLTGRLHEQGLRLEAILREHADVCHRLGRKELAVAALQRHIKVVSKENRELHESLRDRENRIVTLERHP